MVSEDYLSKLDSSLIQILESWKQGEKDSEVKVFVYCAEGCEEIVLSFLENLGCRVLHRYKFKPVVSVETRVSLIPKIASHSAVIKVSLVGRVRALGGGNVCS